MSDAVITMTGNAQQLVAEIEKVTKASQKVEQQNIQLKRAIKDSGDTQIQMSRGAKQALDQSTTALEKYRETMASLRSALDSGTISQEKYNRARMAAQATFKANDPASIAKAAAAEKKASEEKAAASEKEAKAARDAAAAEKVKAKADADAAAIIDRNKTALERYTERVQAAKKALDSGRLSQEQYRRELDAANKSLSDSAPVSILEKQLTALAGMVSVTQALRMAWRLASEEFQNYVERQRAAASETVTFAEASREMMLNFAPDKTMGVADLGPAIAKISQETGADQKHVAQAFSDTFSSKGDMSNADATAFVAQSFRLAPKSPELAKEMAARALDLSAQTGVKDPKSLLGFLSQVQGQSRITSMPQLGKQGVPAILGAMKAGASLEQSAEVFAAINNLMKDAEGANSKTATLQLFSHLMDQEKIGKAGLGGAFKDKNVMQRLAMLQGDKKLADRFLKAEGVSFEIQAKPFIEGFVRGDAESMAAFNATRRGIGGIDANSPRAFEALVQQIQSGPGQGVGDLNSQLGALNQGDKVGASGALAGVVRDQLFADKNVFGVGGQNLEGIDSMKRDILRAFFEKELLRSGSAAKAGITALNQEINDRNTAWGATNAAGPNAVLIEMRNILQRSLEMQEKGNAPQAPQAPLLAPTGGNPVFDHPGAR